MTTTIAAASGVLRLPGYGRGWVWPHLLFAIRAARTPNDRGAAPHTAHFFDVAGPSAGTENWRRRLRHKAICDTPTVTAQIAVWIRGRDQHKR